MAAETGNETPAGSDGGSGFYKFFKTMPPKSETTIRFFNRTDYYTVHEDDAVFVAKEVFKSTSNIKTYGTGKSLVLNKNQFESLVKDLLLSYHYRVEVYNNQSGSKNNDWTLEYKGSPGNLSQFEDLLAGCDQVVGTMVLAIKTSGEARSKVIGVATVDMSERSIAMGEFQDDENYTELEGLLVQLAPKEILLPDSAEYKAITKVAGRCGALVTPRKGGEFNADGLTQDLNRILEWKAGQVANSAALPEVKSATAAAALSSLVRYLELSGDENNFGQFSLSAVERHRYVHVDTSAAKALGLIAPPGPLGHGQSLVGFLDRCRTPQGHRLLAQWVKQPLRDLRAIAHRQDMVEALVADAELRVELSEEHLRRFPDLQLLARRLQRKNASMQDCYKIYQAVERVQALVAALQRAGQVAALRETFLDRLADLEEDMAKFQEMVSTTLDMGQVGRGEFLVRADFSEELTEQRAGLDQVQAAMEADLSRSARELGLEAGKSLKLESNAQHGHYFRTANKKEEKNIRNHHLFTLIDANKAGMRFQSKELARLNQEYMQMKKCYDESQRSIVEEIMNIAVGYVPAVLALNAVSAQLDVVTSFALVAANAPTRYVRPSLLPPGGGKLLLRQARHPLLEVQDSVSFIPNDAVFDADGTCFYVITGPNMGGKSTFIRTVGVCVLLAHIGAFVPCDEAVVTLNDALLARIGAGDCQLTGVSTFMNEMVETAAILRRATAESLVMIDELGRGTSTYEGCGLAWAIAKHLAGTTKSFSLFATHFQELTALPEEAPSAANLHVTATAGEEGLTLLYQVRPGPSDRSFGLEVARMARFQPHVIECKVEGWWTVELAKLKRRLRSLRSRSERRKGDDIARAAYTTARNHYSRELNHAKEARRKQMELEQRQGMGITGVALTAEEIQEGEKLLLAYLGRFQAEGLDGFAEIREEISKLDNKYISAVLS